MDIVKRLWEERPLVSILSIGLFLRLISVIFSKGYGMHDDHFLVIEAAQSFVDGFDYNDWLPGSSENATPTGHSWFYVGIHYFILKALDTVGLTSPQGKMYIIRFLHALYSLIIILLGYKITLKVSNLRNAKMVGLLLSILWLFPILSVRNLVEFVCIPPLLGATWVLVRKDNPIWKDALIAGALAGIAMGFRFHSILFIGGFGLALWMQKKWLEGVLFGIAAAALFSTTQIGDLFIWGAPFQEVGEYIRYNFANETTYFNRPWYMYIGTIGGLLIPPISLFFMFGYFKAARKYILIFLPSFIFLLFHSYFSNKQERFILPAIPFVIMLGYIGWAEFKSQSKFWANRPKLEKGFWTFFWILNTLALLIITPAYSKRSRVEVMSYLSTLPDYNNMIIESSHKWDYLMPPKYYLGSWKDYWYTHKKMKAEKVAELVKTAPDSLQPNYIVFMEEVHLEERLETFQTGYGKEIELVKIIEPSNIDKLLHWLNPNNDNQTARVYKFKETNQ